MRKSRSPAAYAVLGLIPLSLITIAACSTAAQPVPSTAPDAGMCTADQLNRFRGQPATQELGRQIKAESGARIFRWLPKGSIVTMEYNGDRVNVRLDENNRVESVSCS